MCVHDRDGRFVYFNRAAEEVSGFASGDAVGRHPRELVLVEEEEDDFDLLLSEIWADRRPRPGHGHWRARDGEIRRLERQLFAGA